MKRKPYTNEDGEIRELTAEDFKHFEPAHIALPKIFGEEMAAELLKRKRGQRGKQKKPTKQPVTLRLDPEVVRYFKSTGAGWQSRISLFLKAAVVNLTH